MYSTFEYVPGRMILSLALNDLLIVYDWVPQRLIQRNVQANIYKNFFLKLPKFDEEKFPFIACSGYEHISLINVRDQIMQIFIRSPCKTVQAQQAFFFKEEKFGYSMHFASKENSHSAESHRWHSLELK